MEENYNADVNFEVDCLDCVDDIAEIMRVLLYEKGYKKGQRVFTDDFCNYIKSIGNVELRKHLIEGWNETNGPLNKYMIATYLTWVDLTHKK